MALLAEELVEEWLRRQGYFTIRGAKVKGNKELDLLAIRIRPEGMERRHIKVQASRRPVTYISQVPKSIQKKKGRHAASAMHRTDSQLRKGVHEWILKKYRDREIHRLCQALARGPWSRELVVRNVRHESEIQLIKKAGIKVLNLDDIIGELKQGVVVIKGASGADLADLATGR